MLRVTRLTDYGIAMLGHMASSTSRLSSRDLAGVTGLPLTTASKILKALCKQGLLVSTRGAEGGYALARTADEITVADIVIALEGPISITQGSVSTTTLTGASPCPIGDGWLVLNRAVCQALRTVTLAQLQRTGEEKP